jgi:hypothetical protein
MVKIMKLSFFLMVFVNDHIRFQIWTRIGNPRVTDLVPDQDPEKVLDPCGSGSGSGSGSTTLPKSKIHGCLICVTMIYFILEVISEEGRKVRIKVSEDDVEQMWNETCLSKF